MILRALMAAWVFLFWVVIPAEATATSDGDAVFDMPLVETETVITDWLAQNGYQVYSASTGNQRMVLTADKAGSRLEIILTPNSPLATKARFASPQGDSSKTFQDLRSHLQGYIGMPGVDSSTAGSDVPDAVRAMSAAVVCMYSKNDSQEIQFSGFVIDSQGWILCTAHDLTLSQKVTIMRDDGHESDGRVVKLDSQRDLALVHASLPFPMEVSLRDGRYLLRNGDPLFAVTCPNGRISGIQAGTLDGPPRRVEGFPLWQVRMHVDHGSSGSPVFDHYGRLAAVVKGRYRGTDSIGFLIPFETLLNFLEKY
jgi:serine protease Do